MSRPDEVSLLEMAVEQFCGVSLETKEVAEILKYMEAVEAENTSIRKENDCLRALVKSAQQELNEAANDIQDWGDYASKYFQEKHDLAGVVAEHRAFANSLTLKPRKQP